MNQADRGCEPVRTASVAQAAPVRGGSNRRSKTVYPVRVKAKPNSRVHVCSHTRREPNARSLREFMLLFEFMRVHAARVTIRHTVLVFGKLFRRQRDRRSLSTLLSNLHNKAFPI